MHITILRPMLFTVQSMKYCYSHAADDGKKNSSESSCYAYIYCYFYVFTQLYKSLKHASI